MVRNDALNVALDAGENPYLMGGYAPVDTEIGAEDLEVIGEIPADLNGLYVRNGPNPRFTTEGRYHWFDGDGMLHAIHLRDGTATYRNRWIRTDGFAADGAARRALWKGVAEDRGDNPDDGSRLRLKDTANTDVVFHNGNLVALWYLAGEPYRMDPLTLETVGKEDWQGTRQSCVSAHAKVDQRTGEFLFFDYGPVPPYMSYGVVSPDGVLKHFVPIDLPGARMPHDMAITERLLDPDGSPPRDRPRVGQDRASCAPVPAGHADAFRASSPVTVRRATSDGSRRSRATSTTRSTPTRMATRSSWTCAGSVLPARLRCR